MLTEKEKEEVADAVMEGIRLQISNLVSTEENPERAQQLLGLWLKKMSAHQILREGSTIKVTPQKRAEVVKINADLDEQVNQLSPDDMQLLDQLIGRFQSQMDDYENEEE